MKKIFFNKNDDASLAVEKILGETAKDIVLVIPKFSRLAESVSNFHLIKREADADNKNLLVESVDENALALAQAANIPGVNPFLSGRRKSMSDIIIPEKTLASINNSKENSSEIEKNKAKKEELIKDLPNDLREEVDFTEMDASRRPRRKKLLLWLLSITVVSAVGLSFLFSYMPSVKISLNLKQTPFEFNEKVKAEKGISEINTENNIIGAEVFSENKNIALSFPASGTKKVEKKASGTVTIFNAYSSEKQALVANTRLLAPDGKIFRLVSAISVPGAKISQGQITPSSISFKVIADKAGEEYNIKPVSRFTIPGFQGSSKYESFYAESKEAMSGGFIGSISFPTDNDIKKVKGEIENKLNEILKGAALAGIPSEFYILDGSSQFTITKMEIGSEVGTDNNFSAVGEAEMKTIAFKKDQLLAFLKDKSEKISGFNIIFSDSSFDFSKIKADFLKGQLEFYPGFKGTSKREIDAEVLKNEIKGKTASHIREYILSLSGIEKAAVSFWPFWISKASENPSRINISFDL